MDQPLKARLITKNIGESSAPNSLSPSEETDRSLSLPSVFMSASPTHLFSFQWLEVKLNLCFQQKIPNVSPKIITEHKLHVGTAVELDIKWN